MACAVALALGAPGAHADPADRPISALGRIEPGEGVIQVAGPSGPPPVVAQLLVKEGDRVEKGATLAILDSFALRRADVERLTAELENTERGRRRIEQLYARSSAAEADLDAARIAARVAKARLEAARARLDLSRVRSPVAGQVLEIHTREGERLASEGLVEIGETDRMYAVAEVYETDVSRVRLGQRARIASPAFERPIAGTVEAIGLEIGKLDVLDTDPVAKIDARVIEVRIRLDADHGVERLTNLQVEVRIESGAREGENRLGSAAGAKTAQAGSP
jgi:HlyD family secretion protein